MTRYEIENFEGKKKGLEIIGISDKIFFNKPVSPQEKENNIKKAFKDILNREITEEELKKYIQLFDNKKTNIWKFTEDLKNKESNSEVINNESECDNRLQ